MSHKKLTIGFIFIGFLSLGWINPLNLVAVALLALGLGLLKYALFLIPEFSKAHFHAKLLGVILLGMTLGLGSASLGGSTMILFPDFLPAYMAMGVGMSIFCISFAGMLPIMGGLFVSGATSDLIRSAKKCHHL